jgi:hypothetical protein
MEARAMNEQIVSLVPPTLGYLATLILACCLNSLLLPIRLHVYAGRDEHLNHYIRMGYLKSLYLSRFAILIASLGYATQVAQVFPEYHATAMLLGFFLPIAAFAYQTFLKGPLSFVYHGIKLLWRLG